jgi:hypothetical protein
MIDISELLIKAVKDKSHYDFNMIVSAYLKEIKDATIDHDDGVPEDWAMLLVSSSCEGLLRVSEPFAIILDSSTNQIAQFLAAHKITFVSVSDFSADELTMNENIFNDQLKHWTFRGHVDFNGFAANDLWWSTI